ncbi:tyrosine-type recombinase/integrase [Methylomonas albis]|uniref:Site-specific integrase n=1 Tax=Methylomonas albis TaxID=1854563 RepID=A0ABR9D3L6_9GAMM|nr:site-specific integrase [Methylomonas albis]MBD9356814.1 site-specific integrase [Methylomonas albis]
MANIRKRVKKDGVPYYTVQIRLKGYEPQSATFGRLTDAKRWAASTESAIREGRHFKTTEAKKHTVAEMIERYLLSAGLTKTQDEHTGLHLRRWNEEIGYMMLSDVTADTLTLVKDKLLNETVRTGQKRSPTTALRYMASLSKVFNTAVKSWGWLEDSPMRNIEKPRAAKGRVRFLDDDERERLTKACKESLNPLLYPAFILALSTGMRQAETMNLYWGKAPANPPTEGAWGVVLLEQGCIILHKTKNTEKRRIPLTCLALQLLKDMSKVRRIDTPLVFPSHKNPLKPIDLKTPWLKAMAEAEIKGFTWHDIRHTTASYLAMNGASLAEIAEVLGHKTLQMVQRYAHLSDGHITGVVERMNNKLFGGG